LSATLSAPRVYAIADAEALAPRPLPDAVAEMADEGIEWIQVRAKHLADDDLYRQVEACCRAVEGTRAALWIDDRADLASLLPVAGLHVGQADLPPSAARRAIAECGASGESGDRWLGSSTHDLQQVAAAAADPAVDVVAVGPVFATRSKADAQPVVGLELLRQARRLTTKPIVAIGGIDETNAAGAWAAGADAVAMIGAICRGELAANCRRLLRVAEEWSYEQR
jgi:thiamine-phosphate pyrophosphorylase